MDYFEYGDLSRLYRLFESIASFITLIIIVSIAVQLRSTSTMVMC